MSDPADHTGARGWRRGLAPSLLARTVLLSAVWWALVEGRLGSRVLAAIAVLAAVLASYPLLPLGFWDWRFRGLLRFVPFFLEQSIQGGIDVAWRALHPRPPIQPGFVEYPLRLPEGPARGFFVATFSLLPGTLSADLRDGTLRIHLLHRGIPAQQRIQELELRVAALFAVDL